MVLPRGSLTFWGSRKRRGLLTEWPRRLLFSAPLLRFRILLSLLSSTRRADKGNLPRRNFILENVHV